LNRIAAGAIEVKIGVLVKVEWQDRTAGVDDFDALTNVRIGMLTRRGA